jgi:predicted TIM-barrel fold metal-dependent hydrolase
MHVHVVGNGSSGSGCWIRPRGWHRLFASYMLQHVGLPQAALRGDLDRLYVECVLRYIRSSSLSAAVILAQDQVYHADGRLMEDAGTFYVPNDHVFALTKQHPEFLPACSIHPARPDALEELDRCIAAGAVMMKCLPNCHNIDCNDRRYTKFWERMAAAGLPLLAHTGGEHTVQIINAAYADPRILELPLQCGVTCIAAHCGTRGGLVDPDYFDVLVEMFHKYPNLYADLSAFNIPTRSCRYRQCRQPPLVDRMLHGSDFPVPIMGHWAWMRGLIDWKTFRTWERQTNHIERDYQLKRAIGFPDDVFTRVWNLIPPPRP